MSIDATASLSDIFSSSDASGRMEEGWDRFFLRASSLLAEPACKAFELLRFRLVMPLDPKKFDNYPSVMQEIAFRAFIIAAAVFAGCSIWLHPFPILFTAVALTSTIKILRAIGYALQKNDFTYIQGSALEKPVGSNLKVMTWNVCGISGGMHYDHGGVISWRARLDKIVEMIRKEDPDVLILQEIYDTELCEALQEKLGPHYAHFFTHLGPNVLGSEGGLLMATKNKVANFSHTSFENNDWTLNRGFASLELQDSRGQGCIRIIGTHLIHGSDDEKRKPQVGQIANFVQQLPKLPTVIAGDLNIERDEAGRTILNAHLIHGYQGTEPTCTNRLAQQWENNPKASPDEMIDYISFFKNTVADNSVRFEECKALASYDPITFDTQTALSDHKALVATIRRT